MSRDDAELYRAHRQGQDRYDYFLLAAAGAGIGFALNQTTAEALAWAHIPLGIAVLCWGGSFFAGCRRLAFIDVTLAANQALLQVNAGTHPEIGQHPLVIEAGRRGILSAIEKNQNGAQFWGRAQFRLLVSGALLYIAWHILEMYLRRA